MTAALVRHPVVAGKFYPADAEDLLAEVRSYLTRNLAPTPAIGCIVPHAGYPYSGHVAGAVFAELKVPELCLILCPNHTGMGRPLAIMSEGQWETPLGQVAIEHTLASSLKQRCPLLEEDTTAHLREHAIEVELPFLQTIRPDMRFVPIAVGTRNFAVLETLGRALADVIALQTAPVLIVASSDMNHYESDAVTRDKDRKAIDEIVRLDARGLLDTVQEKQISMCGVSPVIVLLTAANALGATSGKLVRYATSGDISGDTDTVVGYAGMIVRKD